MATKPANGLLQKQQVGRPGFLSLSLSPASMAVKCTKKKRAQPADDDGAFQCGTCGRGFATFQALGGHRASHKRPRVRAKGLDLLLGACPAGKGTAGNVVHRCHSCGTVFPTGQALGGHMRRHRAGVETEAATTVALSQDTDGENEEDHLPCTLIRFI